MTSLAKQVHDLVADRAGALFEQGDFGLAAGAATAAASVWRVYDAGAFTEIAAPALQAMVGHDAEAAAAALPAIQAVRDGSPSTGDPDDPSAVITAVTTSFGAALSLAAGTGGPEDIIRASDAGFVLAQRLGEVETFPEVEPLDFPKLVADPSYLAAHVPVTWRDAARQVRAVRLAGDDAWSTAVAEGDAFGQQLASLARVLIRVRGPVSASYPTISDFDFRTGRARAVRTVSPTLLADHDAVRTTVQRWVAQVAGFVGHRRVGSIAPVPRAAIRSRELIVGIPKGTVEDSRPVFEELAGIAAAGSPPVTLRIAEVG